MDHFCDSLNFVVAGIDDWLYHGWGNSCFAGHRHRRGACPDLAEFVVKFIENPEIFFSMPDKRRREIENQRDAILSSFEH